LDSGAFDEEFDPWDSSFCRCRVRIGGGRCDRMRKSKANLVARRRFNCDSADHGCRTSHVTSVCCDHAQRSGRDRLLVCCRISALRDRWQRLASRQAAVGSALGLFARRAEAGERRAAGLGRRLVHSRGTEFRPKASHSVAFRGTACRGRLESGRASPCRHGRAGCAAQWPRTGGRPRHALVYGWSTWAMDMPVSWLQACPDQWRGTRRVG
jgi:hypothetical protein